MQFTPLMLFWKNWFSAHRNRQWRLVGSGYPGVSLLAHKFFDVTAKKSSGHGVRRFPWPASFCSTCKCLHSARTYFVWNRSSWSAWKSTRIEVLGWLLWHLFSNIWVHCLDILQTRENVFVAWKSRETCNFQCYRQNFVHNEFFDDANSKATRGRRLGSHRDFQRPKKSRKCNEYRLPIIESMRMWVTRVFLSAAA